MTNQRANLRIASRHPRDVIISEPPASSYLVPVFAETMKFGSQLAADV